ncbi:MAG: hypothetical protein WDZ73_00615 [Candidatus Paceibacterota bacterium]
MLKDLAPLFFVLALIFFLIFVVFGAPNRDEAGSLFTTSNTFRNYVPSVGTQSGGGGGAGAPTSHIGPYEPETVVVNNRTYIKSPWFGQVSIGRGNSKNAYQPREEYITLTAGRRNDQPIQITGWRLSNADSERLFDVSGRVVAGNTNRAVIGQGVEVLLPEGSRPHLVYLKPGDKAVVTSGSLYSRGEVDIKSGFRLNKCTGYLQKTGDYSFIPSLALQCPNPKEVAGFEVLPESCYNYVRRLARCHTPNTEPFRDRNDELVRNHVDGNIEVSRFCREFVTTNFSYCACVATHYNDDDFLKSEWRLFLNLNW